LLLSIGLLVVAGAAYSVFHSAAAEESLLTLNSASYHLDKLYRSMEGPSSVQSDIELAPSSHFDLPNRVASNAAKTTSPIQHFVWLTGIDTTIVDAKSQAQISPEYFCHSNLTFAEHGTTPEQYNARLGGKIHFDWRLFSLVPGRSSIELPQGFGIPVPSDASLDYFTMSLNQNPRNEVDVRMRTHLHTVSPDETNAPTKALFRRAVYVLQHEGAGAHSAADHKSCNAKSLDHVGAGCGEWKTVTAANGSTMLMPVEGMTNHWTVPPGHHVYQSDITPQLNLPFDTTIHYATIHVHPFARGMELRDLTTGKAVLQLNSRDWTDRIGVAHVDEFKSTRGLPITRGHHYQLSVDYDNTSAADTDAMAILYLYLLERQI